jgi:hypothetical protein
VTQPIILPTKKKSSVNSVKKIKDLKKDRLIFKFLKKKVESDEVRKLREELLKASSSSSSQVESQ